MRLFWKLFCSMVMITALACSVGGFVLIDGQFRTSLSAQAEMVMTENALLRRTFLRELQFSGNLDEEGAVQLAERTAAAAEERGLRFRLADSRGQPLVGSHLPGESALSQSLGEDRQGWEVLQNNGRYYLHASSPLVLDGGVVYLENWRGAGDLFAAREEQYHVFFYLLMGLILVSALAALAVSAWLSRPLGRLSAAARQMAGGELSQRVGVSGDDEIGRLSRDFNQMADQLERQVGELTDTARRQRDFLQSFAHETKTPLTSIIGYAELVLSRPDQPELVQESAACIFREGRRLEGLSRKLMDLIILEKEALPLRRVEMPAFLERMAGVLRPRLEQEGIRFEIRTDPGTAEIEPDLMESVCLNLLDNARKAVPKEGVICMEGIRTADGYCIRVSDNGRGIPREDLARITEPFYMVDKSRSRTQGGAGLGLAVCQRIVTLHGGTLEFESELGRGTRVSVCLKGGGDV